MTNEQNKMRKIAKECDAGNVYMCVCMCACVRVCVCVPVCAFVSCIESESEWILQFAIKDFCKMLSVKAG